MQTYTLSGIQSMLGLSRSVITGLIAAGFVTPSRGKRREYRFSFQDVVLLRTAYSLQSAQISPRKILRSLRQLKATLPDELPLTGLRIAAVGNDIAVKEGKHQWEAESGQLLIDFEVRPQQGSVTFLSRAPQPVNGAHGAQKASADD
ncbi:MAG TPA: MerR family transcriptional regulator, partial [Albitalea sp.]|nr:MerR family transcriptional regulator [Albitalea sp.]